MKRNIKNMYTEMILDTIINGKWDMNSKTNWASLFDTEIVYFASNEITVGKYKYRFRCNLTGLFLKNVNIYVRNGNTYGEKTDEISYSIFSPVYWRIVQMNLDRKKSIEIAETNLYIDTYKAFKKHVVERDIAQVEQSLANLAKAEQEQKKLLEELKSKGVC